MTVTTCFKGYEAYYDFEKKDWFYTDDNTSVTKNPRVCRRCGHHSIKENGVECDYCLGYLGKNVISACCGHGVSKGYIVFKKNGRIFEEVINND